MFCKYCGAKMSESANFCSACGRSINEPIGNQQNVNQAPSQNNYDYNANNYNANNYTPNNNYASNNAPNNNYAPNNNAANNIDASNGGFAFLCFMFPAVGLILYLVWREQYPLKAKSCGIGALIGVLVWFFCGIVTGILYAVLFSEIIKYGYFALISLATIII